MDPHQGTLGPTCPVRHVLLLHHPRLRDHQALESARPVQGPGPLVTTVTHWSLTGHSVYGCRPDLSSRSCSPSSSSSATRPSSAGVCSTSTRTRSAGDNGHSLVTHWSLAGHSLVTHWSLADHRSTAVGQTRPVGHVLLLHHPRLRDHQALESARPVQGPGALVTTVTR